MEMEMEMNEGPGATAAVKGKSRMLDTESEGWPFQSTSNDFLTLAVGDKETKPKLTAEDPIIEDLKSFTKKMVDDIADRLERKIVTPEWAESQTKAFLQSERRAIKNYVNNCKKKKVVDSHKRKRVAFWVRAEEGSREGTGDGAGSSPGGSREYPLILDDD